MDYLAYGAELELLVRPKLEKEETATLFREKNWNPEKSLVGRERVKNSTILRQILAEELMGNEIPATLTDRTYEQWIVDRDGSILEPRDEDGGKSFCMLRIIWSN